MTKGGFVYIMSSFRRTVLYTGVTSTLQQRVWQHRTKSNPDSFAAKYDCVICVYYKFYDTIQAAIAEEKRIKGLRRELKDKLIESMNSDWKDLWPEIEEF
jgi:putative endonuclease